VISNHTLTQPMASSCAPAQTVVITGCSAGLGLSLVKEFICLGHRVAGCARRQDRIEALMEEYGNSGHYFEVVDVGNADAVAQFAKNVGERFSTIDVLVCNAGLGGKGALPWEIPAEYFDTCTKIGLNGVFYTCKHFIPMMLKNMDQTTSFDISIEEKSRAFEVAKHKLWCSGVTDYNFQITSLKLTDAEGVDVPLESMLKAEFHAPLHVEYSVSSDKSTPVVKRVINMSSGIAHTSNPFTGDYMAVKYGVEGYSKSVAQAFRLNPAWKDRIICVPFSPGVVRTEMMKKQEYRDSDTWCKEAVPFVLNIDASDNGSSMVMPGYYPDRMIATWTVPPDAKMNSSFELP